METKIENANAYRRRRNAQMKWCMLFVLIAIVSVAYLMYTPSKPKRVQGNRKPQVNKIVKPDIKDINIVDNNDNLDDADYYGTTTYGGFMHLFSTTFGNFQDILGRPHYRAWDELYTTTYAPELKEENEDNSEDSKDSGTLPQVPAPKEPTKPGIISKIMPTAPDKPKEVLVGDEIMKTTDPLKVNKIDFLDKYKNPCFHYKKSGSTDAELHCLPSFFVVGMPRSGTGDLYQRLSNHPNIVQSERNSPSWWTKSSKEQIPFSKYIEHFKYSSQSLGNLADKENQQGVQSHDALIFDSNPKLFWKGLVKKDEKFMTPVHVKQILPNARIIVLVRDPAERLYSEYNHFNPKASPETFDKFVKDSIAAFKECKNSLKSENACVHKDLEDDSKPHLEIGMYNVFYNEWLKSFDKSEILVVRVEDYGKDTATWLKKIHQFIGLPQIPATVLENLAGSEFKSERNLNRSPMKETTKKTLVDFYTPYNNELAVNLNDPVFKYDKQK